MLFTYLESHCSRRFESGLRGFIKIRESVKYVKASDGRLREFQKCVEEVHLDDIGSFLRLDVSAR